MSHPIVVLQAALVAALRADAGVGTLVGEAIFDAPPKGAGAPYVAIARHDLVPRDGDLAPGFEHRLVVHVWADGASRKAALVIAEAVTAVVLEAAVAGLTVTLRRLERTETAIDAETGLARAALTFRMLSEWRW